MANNKAIQNFFITLGVVALVIFLGYIVLFGETDPSVPTFAVVPTDDAREDFLLQDNFKTQLECTSDQECADAFTAQGMPDTWYAVCDTDNLCLVGEGESP